MMLLQSIYTVRRRRKDKVCDSMPTRGQTAWRTTLEEGTYGIHMLGARLCRKHGEDPRAAANVQDNLVADEVLVLGAQETG
jgi:hypothetical protein